MTDPDLVAALASQLEELRGQLARSQGEVGYVKARLEEFAGQDMVMLHKIKELGEQLDKALAGLRTEVQDLAEALAKAVSKNRLTPPPAPYWLGLSGDQYLGQLAKLQKWVDKVAHAQYPDYFVKLPPCWPNHPEAIWELSNLMIEWARVYGDEGNEDLAAALWFHERWLPGVLARLAKAILCDEAGCRRSQEIREP